VRPYTTAGGKTLHVRVESAKQPSVTELRSWAAHEKVSVRCRAVNPQRSVGFDAEHPFPVGESSTQFIDRLRTFLLTPVKQTRGFHRRPFCSDPMARSSAEIRVEESRPHLRGTALICLPDTIDSRGPRGK